MLTYTAVGTPREVSDYLDDFVRVTGADELITVHQVPKSEGRLRSVHPVGRGDAGRLRMRIRRSSCRAAPFPR